MAASEPLSVHEEAARLVESLRAAAGSFEDSEPAAGEHAQDCQWCPLCRGARILQSVSPETISRLADLASFAAIALGDLASRQAERQARRPGAWAADEHDSRDD